MRTLYLPDVPIVEDAADKLDLKKFVSSIHGALSDAAAPFVFGIFGDWGVGKTSAMRLLERKLEQDVTAGVAYNIPIWINIWKYENELDMVYPILFELKRDFEKRLPISEATTSLMKDFVRVAGASLFALADLGLRAVTKQAVGEAIKVKDIVYHYDLVAPAVGELEQRLEAWATQVTQLPQLYEEFVDTYAHQLARKFQVEPSCIRLVFLIDDLDRCLPDTVIDVLERIKNFLSVNRCVYFLAVNQHVVQQGIRNKFASVELDGREYLEKIVNYSFHVPEPLPDAVSSFALGRLNELLPDEKDRSTLQPHLQNFGQILGACGFSNPRKITRILNRYLAFVLRHSSPSYVWNTKNIVRLLIMAEYFPAVFQVFWANASGAKEELLALADGASTFPAFEAKHGISLGISRERIAGMRQLFDLQAPFQPGEPDIKAHIIAVAEFTRVR